MYPLVESIKILNGRIYHLPYHESRVNHSRLHLFDIHTPIYLKNKISVPPEYKNGLVKCRIIYEKEVLDVSYQSYAIRDIRTIRVVYDDVITYPYKYLNRKPLDLLLDKKGAHDEIIIVKNGKITDAYYYNIIAVKDCQWYSPRTPLLRGVMREKIVSQNKCVLKDIRIDDIQDYDMFYLINALTPPGKIVLTPENFIF